MDAPGLPGCFPRFFFSARSAARRCLLGGFRPGRSSELGGIEEFPLFRDPARSAVPSCSRRPATTASSAAICSACAAISCACSRISASRGSSDGTPGGTSVTARNHPGNHARPPRQHHARRWNVTHDYSPQHQAQGPECLRLLPNISFVDPEFALADDGTGGDDHPKADIRRGERFIADVYHALADAGYLDNTVLVITFDEWGGFFEHVRPPRVIDDTNPADADHTGNSTTPTDGRLVPDYAQLGFRVPAIVVSNRASRRVVHDGPFEHTSTLKMIESTFGLHPLTARDANAMDLRQVLRHQARRPVPPGLIPASSQVPGPATDAAAVCSAASVPSVSPSPASKGKRKPEAPVLPQPGHPTRTGMGELAQRYSKGTTR